MSEKKLHVGFDWIVYSLASACKPAEFPLTVKGQRSMMEVTLRHPRVKANLGINSYVVRLYKEQFPEMIDLVKSGIDSGQFEITSMTHSEDIINVLPYDEMVREVVWNLDALEETFGVRPVGAYNPEQGWDPVSGKVLLEAGVEWIAISNWQLSSMAEPAVHDETDLYKSAYLKTIGNSKIKAVFNSLDAGSWRVPEHFRQGPNVFLNQVILGTHDEKLVVPAFERLQKLNADGNMFFLHSEDSEDFWRSPYYGKTDLSQSDMEERFDSFLTTLESLSYVEFVTISEYLNTVPPKQEYIIRPSVGLFDRDGFGLFTNGIENQAYPLAIQSDRAGEDIRHAELLLEILEAKGKDTMEVKGLIREAWETLGMAKTASGKGYAVNDAFTLWCCDHAIKAQGLAKQAIKKCAAML